MWGTVGNVWRVCIPLHARGARDDARGARPARGGRGRQCQLVRCVVWVTAGADRRDTLIQRRGGALMRTGAWLEAGTREAKPKVNGEEGPNG